MNILKISLEKISDAEEKSATVKTFKTLAKINYRESKSKTANTISSV